MNNIYKQSKVDNRFTISSSRFRSKNKTKPRDESREMVELGSCNLDWKIIEKYRHNSG